MIDGIYQGNDCYYLKDLTVDQVLYLIHYYEFYIDADKGLLTRVQTTV